MTAAEFKKLTRQVWDQYPLITQDVMLELQETYLEAASLVQAEVLRAERLDLSSLTIDSKNAINFQLEKGVALIQPASEQAIVSGITNTIDLENAVTQQWLDDAYAAAGLSPLNMNPLNTIVREKVLTLTISRQFQDGYTLSQRVWESASLYKTDMSRAINLGLAQGKDNIKIAAALSEYIKGGRKALKRAGVYGKIKRGNGKIYSRISQNVDWRALRLVRSEEYMSLQASAVLRGENNPGATGLYNWRKNPYTAFDCTCNTLDANSPYLAENIPDYPHPNCLCTIEPILRNQKEFVADLKEYAAGGSVPYLEKWYTEKYNLTN